MRKVLIAAAALTLCAAPAKAQQALAAADAAPAAAVQAPQAAAPALFPTTDQVKQDVRTTETRNGHARAPLGSRDWWYVVAAVAVGVIIAAILL